MQKAGDVTEHAEEDIDERVGIANRGLRVSISHFGQATEIKQSYRDVKSKGEEPATPEATQLMLRL